MTNKVLYNTVKKRNGFTLTELLVALVILSMVLAAIFSFYFFQHKTYSRSVSKSQIQENVRLFSDYLSNQLRNSTDVQLRTDVDSELPTYNQAYISSNQIIVTDASGNNILETYDISSNAKIEFDLVRPEIGSQNNAVLHFTVEGEIGNDFYGFEFYSIDNSIAINNFKPKSSDLISGTRVYFLPGAPLT